MVLSIARLLDHGSLSRPLPLVKDGDLIATVQHMIFAGEPDTVRVTKVKDHATETDVEQDRVGRRNIEADTAADLGGRHQQEAVVDISRALIKTGGFWYPIVLQLHRFMVAIFRVSVVLPLILLSRISVVGLSSLKLISGLMLILLCVLGLLVSCAHLGFRSMVHHWCRCCCLAV